MGGTVCIQFVISLMINNSPEEVTVKGQHVHLKAADAQVSLVVLPLRQTI